MLLDKTVTLTLVENFFQSTHINDDIKLSCLPLIFTNEKFLKKYQNNNKLPHLMNEIINFIKDKNVQDQVHLTEQSDIIIRTNENLKKLLSSKTCPVALLDFFSTNEKRFLRMTIAENKNCPEDILMKLSNDKSSLVLMNVIRNASTNSKMLDTIYNTYCNDYDNYPSLYLTNKNCSSNLLEKIFNDHIKNFNYLSLQEDMINESNLNLNKIQKKSAELNLLPTTIEKINSQNLNVLKNNFNSHVLKIREYLKNENSNKQYISHKPI